MQPLLQAENITKSYGEKLLFTNISLFVARDEKVALVAGNGEGKTSLLNILAGDDTPDEGTISVRKNLSTGYLRQEPDLDEDLTVIDQVFCSGGEISNTIRDYRKAMESGDRDLINKMTDRMDTLGAWQRETKAKQILTKLDITGFDKKVGKLSGGEKKRVALAAVLIDEPEMLLLDEPTNHLDTDMTEWLENYLNKSGNTIFMVTHDRYFLDRVCTRIVELDDNDLYSYEGNYSYFVEKRRERLEQMQAQTEKARNLLRKELEWMRRTPKARTSKPKYRINSVDELKEKAAGKEDRANMKIKSGSRRLGSKILEIRNLNKSFGEEPVINDFSYTFSRFEKAGIIGKNGTGKSTFLNLVTGKLTPDSGEVIAGETVRFGYYRQEGISFREDQKVIDAASEIADTVKMADGSVITASAFLNHFLFPPKRQHEFIGKLSGGEKRRLYLVTVLMRNPNFLILDEPTNDLDIDALNVLEEHLAEAKICLLVVSHDRFFMDKVVDHLFVFEGEGKISDFPGNYTQYRNHLRQAKNDNRQEQKSGKKETAKKPERKEKQKLSYHEKRELQQIEKDINELEKEKASLENTLSNPQLSNDELQKHSERFAEIEKEIDEKTERWMELSEIETG